jgi:hypothetical protein
MAKTLIGRVKEVLGTAQAMGGLCEGQNTSTIQRGITNSVLRNFLRPIAQNLNLAKKLSEADTFLFQCSKELSETDSTGSQCGKENFLKPITLALKMLGQFSTISCPIYDSLLSLLSFAIY